MTAPSLAEGVSEEWPPCPCRTAATLSRTLVNTVGCAFLQSTRQVTHTRTEGAQKESTCDGGKLLLGLGQHAFEPKAVSLWPCSTIISMETPTTDTSALASVPVFGQASCNGPGSTSATECIIGGVTVLPALHTPNLFD